MLVAGLLAAWIARPRAAPALGVPVFWAADRGGGALIGLDADLFVVARLAWPAPVALEPAGGAPGRKLLWVASAPRGDPGGGHRLSLVDPSGAGELFALELERLLDLAATPDGGALWLEDHAGRRLLARVDPAGRRRAMAAPAGSVRLAVAPGGVLVGTEAGDLWRFDAGWGWWGGWTRGPRLTGAALGLAPAAGGRGWWTLSSAEDGLAVRRFGPAIELQGGVDLADTHEGALVVVPERTGSGAGGELAWVAAGDAARAWCVGSNGALLSEVPLYQRGVSAGVVGAGGEVVFALPGALVRKATRGDPLPGQGGFDHLVDVAVAE